MGNLTFDLNGRGAFQMGGRLMGIFWLVSNNAILLEERLTFLTRLPESSHAWRLRSSEALDGDNDTLAHVTMVLSRPRMVGLGLSAIDRIP